MDDFTSQLWNIYEKVNTEGIAQVFIIRLKNRNYTIFYIDFYKTADFVGNISQRFNARPEQDWQKYSTLPNRNKHNKLQFRRLYLPSFKTP